MAGKVIACLLAIAGMAVAALEPASAQGTGAGTIAGVVRDESGAVLPGVGVEVSSPVLIEKVRATVSDTDGAYRVAELRPGTYTVVFTLPGFAALRREGIEITSNFTRHHQHGAQGQYARRDDHGDRADAAGRHLVGHPAENHHP